MKRVDQRGENKFRVLTNYEDLMKYILNLMMSNKNVKPMNRAIFVPKISDKLFEILDTIITGNNTLDRDEKRNTFQDLQDDLDVISEYLVILQRMNKFSPKKLDCISEMLTEERKLISGLVKSLK